MTIGGDPLQASSRAMSEAAALSPTSGSPSMGTAKPGPPPPPPPASPNPKSPPSRVEIERKLSSAGRRGGAPDASHSVSPNSTDTESDGGGGGSSSGRERGASTSAGPPPTSTGLGVVGQVNLASISENEDDIDTEEDEFEDDRRTIGSEDRSQMAGLSNEETVLSGYLEKKGERRKTWKKRWFVLRRTTLVYYKNAKEYRLLRMIPLAEVHTCAAVQMKTHFHVFGIVTPKRTYYVRAKSQDDMAGWIDRITDAYTAVKADANAAAAGGAGARSPAEEDAPTPKGADTPTVASASANGGGSVNGARRAGTQPIAIQIPGSSASNFSPSSYSTTTTQPSEGLSTSFTSQSSEGFGAAAPPNSAIPGSGRGLPTSPDLAEVDQTLERLSSAAAPPTAPSAKRTSSQSLGYFGQPPQPQQGGVKNIPPPSPAAVMSSSDEDEYEDDGGLASGPPRLASPEKKVPAAPEAGKVIVQGYLMKQGKRRIWRKRFFSLTSRELVYSKSHMDKDRTPRRIPVAKILDAIEYDPKAHAHSPRGGGGGGGGQPPSSPLHGHFNFATPLGGAKDDAKTADTNCFKIITSQRTFLVAAATEEEEIRWLSALQCLLASQRAPASPTSSGPQPLAAAAAIIGSPPPPTNAPQLAPSPSLAPSQSAGPQGTAGVEVPTQRRPSHGTLPSITSTLIAADEDGIKRRSELRAS